MKKHEVIDYVKSNHWGGNPFCQMREGETDAFSSAEGIQKQLDSLTASVPVIFFMAHKNGSVEDNQSLEILKVSVDLED